MDIEPLSVILPEVTQSPAGKHLFLVEVEREHFHVLRSYPAAGNLQPNRSEGWLKVDRSFPRNALSEPGLLERNRVLTRQRGYGNEFPGENLDFQLAVFAESVNIGIHGGRIRTRERTGHEMRIDVDEMGVGGQVRGSPSVVELTVTSSNGKMTAPFNSGS